MPTQTESTSTRRHTLICRRPRTSAFAAMILAPALLLLAGCSSDKAEPTPVASPTTVATAVAAGAASPKDATYLIEGRSVQLANGLSEAEVAPGSASMITTRYFGNEATGDLNGDSSADAAFLLTQNSGGSGTFYYVVVALRAQSGYTGTNAILLGDRIAPQTTEIRSGEVIVNYADRRPGEPMTAAPSVGVSKYFKVVDGKLVAR